MPLSRRIARLLPMIALVALPFVLLRIEAVRAALVGLIGYMQREGLAGVAAFLGAQSAAALLTTPLWLMSGVAGYAYGFPKGFFVALPGVTIAACCVFLAGRIFLPRSSAPSPAGQSRFWSAVHRAIAKDGLKITLLLRVTFAAPQNLVPYLLAPTPLSFSNFVIATFLGLAPATLFHVYVGSIVTSAAALVSGEGSAKGPLAWVVLGAGLVVTAGAAFAISRVAKRALDRALADDQP